MERPIRRGFTLVELLVVITIIAILVGLLMPGLFGTREAGRRVQCQNNLKQMAVAAQQHVAAQGYFPSGGWGWCWGGEPDRGFGPQQPGGWQYNILPYIDQVTRYRLGASVTNLTEIERIRQVKQRLETPVSLFHCPSRRRAIATPYLPQDTETIVKRGIRNLLKDPPSGQTYSDPDTGAPIWPARMAHSDYAASAGDGPASTSAGPATLVAQVKTDWNRHTGVTFGGSTTQPAHIRDGLSNTYLYGEKFLPPEYYTTGTACSDSHGLEIGHGRETLRWSHRGDLDSPPNDWYAPCRDETPSDTTQGTCWRNFGSAHAGGFNMAFCDSSVHWLNYSIDPETHRRLGSRDGGLPADMTGIQ